MKMIQNQSMQKLGDMGVPSPELVSMNQLHNIQGTPIQQIQSHSLQIHSQSLNPIRDISPLTHKQLNALSPNKSAITQNSKKKNHKIQCPAHQEFDISNMCTAEGCLEPLCPECIRIHTQLHNSEGTSSNIDTIYNKRDQCSEILKEQINLFTQERAVLSQIGDEIRQNLLNQGLEKIKNAKEKVINIIDKFFKDIEETVKEKTKQFQHSVNVENQKSLDNKIQLIISDIQSMESKLDSVEFINSIIQILSGEYDHDYEKIQGEINEAVEKSAAELFEVDFEEQRLYDLNLELQKLLFIKPQNIDMLLSKTLELSRIDCVQTKFESPLKKHNQSVLNHIITTQTKQMLTTNSINNSHSVVGISNNLRSQANEGVQNEQNILNTDQYREMERNKVLVSSQRNSQSHLQRNLSAMVNSNNSQKQIQQSNNKNLQGLDQFMHIPKGQRPIQQKYINNNNIMGRAINQIKESSSHSQSMQPSLNLSRDTSPNRNSVNQDRYYDSKQSVQKYNQKQNENISNKKMYTFNEITTVGQYTERDVQQQMNNNQLNMRQNNHAINNRHGSAQGNYGSSKSQERGINYGQSNPSSQRPSISNIGGEEGISQSVNLEQSSSFIQYQIQINTGDYFSPQCARKFLHFFQDNSKIFHYVDLETLSKDPSSQTFQQQILNIQFKIPMYHRSIITPYGDAFITGGVDVNQKSYVLNSCYKLNYRQATLEPISSMYYPRSNHGIVYCSGYIYVVGGSTNQDNSCLDKCERYDLEVGRWEQISSLKQKCSGCSLSQFSNRYIFKFGGNTDIFTVSNVIERYDLLENEWKIIPFNIFPNHITMKLPSFVGACQINNDEIILLGGSNHNNRLSNVIVVKMYSEECDIVLVKPLPKSGTFWLNPFVLGGVLFSLQNISMDKSPEHSYFGKKRILAFNSSLWKQIGTEDLEIYNSFSSSQISNQNISNSLVKSQLFNSNYNQQQQQSSSRSPFRGANNYSNLKSSSQLKKVFYE